MADQPTTIEDFVQILTEQHDDVKKLMPQVLQDKGPQRRERFAHVRRVLAAHEALEQSTIHLAAEQLGADPAPRIKEETTAEDAIAELENLDVDGDEFETKFRELSDDVVAHAENEENEEFPKLSGELTDSARARVELGLHLVEEANAGELPGDTFKEMFSGAKERITAS